MKIKSTTILIILALIIFGASSFVYFVDERERAIKFRFGEIVDSNIKPGLNFKYPFINNVRFFDARIQTMDADPESYFTIEKKTLNVDSFIKWRIDDVYQYFTQLRGSTADARSRLSQIVNDSLRQEFGKRTLQQVVSGDRAQIMEVVRKAMDQEAKQFGIEVIDVRLKRVDLDPAISEGVYARMQAERQRVAKELRARGEEEAEKIRAAADRERQILLADADRESQQVRGQGDAIATSTYANAFGRDREFYNLYRSLNAYQNTFNSKDDLMVIDPSSEFFRFFKQPGKPEAGSTTANTDN